MLLRKYLCEADSNAGGPLFSRFCASQTLNRVRNLHGDWFLVEPSNNTRHFDGGPLYFSVHVPQDYWVVQNDLAIGFEFGNFNFAWVEQCRGYYEVPHKG
jgi:hypothetical protein